LLRLDSVILLWTLECKKNNLHECCLIQEFTVSKQRMQFWRILWLHFLKKSSIVHKLFVSNWRRHAGHGADVTFLHNTYLLISNHAYSKIKNHYFRRIFNTIYRATASTIATSLIHSKIDCYNPITINLPALLLKSIVSNLFSILLLVTRDPCFTISSYHSYTSLAHNKPENAMQHSLSHSQILKRGHPSYLRSLLPLTLHRSILVLLSLDLV
jgi:hypothetical protein